MRPISGTITAACAAIAASAAMRGGSAPRCADSMELKGPARATAPNYCIPLTPAPGFDSVSAIVELAPIATPFGIAVTREGRPRYHLIATIAGLPDPSTLGAYRAYVAWAYTLSMDSTFRLGNVRNGVTDLGELARDQFRILVTAEASERDLERTGKIIVRGTSPAARTLAHRDLSTAFTPGVLGSAMPNAMPHAHEMFVPGAGANVAALPEAREPQRLTLHDGDTLALTASLVRRRVAGLEIALYAYNGQIPGPTIRVQQGASIVVRFRNSIDMPTAVHWHGVRVENRFDGAVGVTQSAVPPGGEFTYHVRFRDSGLFWYHAHEREDVQLESGLYGNIVVLPVVSAGAPLRRNDLLALSDLTLDAGGAMPYGESAPTHALMGRFGTVLLVNGTERYATRVARGEVIRYLVTNASSARVYNLSFSHARMKLVATDQGRFSRETWVQSLVIAPSERYAVEVSFDSVGTSVLTNRVQALDHPSGTIYPEVDTLGAVTVVESGSRADAAFSTLRPSLRDPALTRALAYTDSAPAHTLLLQMRVHGLPQATMNMLTGVSIPVDWNDGMGAMNAEATGEQVSWVLHDGETGRENMDIAWRFRVGELVKVRVYNDPNGPHPMDHPVHVHGQRMLLLSRNGVPNAFPVWKDTILVPAGEIDDVVIEMSNPGRWMLHCHIAEHRAAGMMMAFQVDST
jgi:FtsP/CotA-like multicopper oxidase with cupredoxin domain